MTDEIKITGEFTPDPAVCKFIVDRTILDEWTIFFKAPDESLGSPLVDRLFSLEGISTIRISGSTITLTKNVPTAWPDMAPDIGKAVREVLHAGLPPVSEEALDAIRNAPVPEIEDVIRQLFDDHINPALSSHGGFVRLVRVEDRDVHLEMGGGCQGCAASQATLRHGIENAIREVVPQVRNIVDVTDHDAGENPYYT